ncbi:MAG: hypothetical protein JWQ84_2839 [Mucilaginibacter sp.]|nr:hypothetical protein [Mucilaginibacter sp.]
MKPDSNIFKGLRLFKFYSISFYLNTKQPVIRHEAIPYLQSRSVGRGLPRYRSQGRYFIVFKQSLNKIKTQLNQIKMETTPFVIERTYNVPAEKVWQAITNKDKMRQWYFDLKEFKPEVGFEFQFYGGSKDEQYLHLCKITEVIAGKKLKHSWQYDGIPGESYVTFELFAEDDKTRLRLTHEGLETFPQNKPDFARESFSKGWTYIIGTSLPEYLERV